MRILMFYHSLVSDWNHGNAHFLRGVATELVARGHEVEVYEPRDSWSAENLVKEQGRGVVREFHAAYPRLRTRRYATPLRGLDSLLEGADMVIVHEWNDPDLVRAIGENRRRTRGYRLYFHDTHHRMVTDPASMARYALADYDGVLAYGRTLQQVYEKVGRVARVWTWHEAADTRLFRPLAASEQPSGRDRGDIVWVGNWGDDERSAELHEYLIRPVAALRLKATVYGVRYPEEARQDLQAAGIQYKGWLPNFRTPQVFAANKVTVHVPRGPYVRALPGIPTIRPFEALACGIPLVCSPWEDTEGLFTPGKDYLLANNGEEMTELLGLLLNDPELRHELAAHGLRTIRERHTCAHRVNELLRIDQSLRGIDADPPERSLADPQPETRYPDAAPAWAGPSSRLSNSNAL